MGLLSQKVKLKVTFFYHTAEDPKFYHRVNTTLNRLVIQFEPSSRCIFFSFLCLFFEKFKNCHLNLQFVTKHHLEELKKKVKIYNEILIGKTPAVRNAIYYLSQKLIFLVWSRWKRNKFKIALKFYIQIDELISNFFFLFIWQTTLTTFFFTKMINVVFIFQDNFFIAPTRSVWHVVSDRWHVTGDMWYVTRDTCHLIGDTCVGWTFTNNFSSIALMVWELGCFEDLEESDDWPTLLLTKLFVEQRRLQRVC